MGDEKPSAEFTYSEMAKVDADWLKQTATALRLRLRRTMREMLDTGAMLTKARRRLGRKQWPAWLRLEAQITDRSSRRFMAVDRAFGAVPSDVLERFTPSALYALAEDGVPQSMREYAVEQAQSDVFVTKMAVEEWMEAYRDDPVAPLKLAMKDAPAVVDVDPDEVYAMENWLMLDKLLGKDGVVHLSASADTEESIGDRWIMGIYTNEKGERRTATAATLERVLLKLCGTGREKECPKCAREGRPAVKPLDEFSVRKDRKDGRNRYCLRCERERVAEYERLKRAKAKAAKPQAA